MNTTLPDDFRPGLGRPQFGLRALLCFVAVVCALLAISKMIGGYSTLVLAFVLLTIAAHVAGTAIGTSLRDNDHRQRRRVPAPLEGVEQLSATHFAPPTKLGQSQALGLTVIACVVIGVLAGGAIGGWLLGLALEDKAR